MFENIDNRTKLLGDDLKKEIKEGSKVRIAASCFSMYVFKELKTALSKINELQFLFTSPTFTKNQLADNTKKEKREFFIQKQNRENSLYGNDFEIRLRNEMTLKTIAKECAEWVKKKVIFKSNITTGGIPNIIGIEKLDASTLIYNSNEMTGFKNTKTWNTLYDFQKDGVISIINKLEKHNGCILADSVGLGKTFTAFAVISNYSLRNKSILLLCPKRLSDNWTQYCGSNNDSNNIFYEDRIRYEVLYPTDLGRVGTTHNGRDLRLINWGKYDLVVIDESYNVRNNNPVKDKETRYNFLINHIIKEGVKTKVLMLSATPVNNRYNDLKNTIVLAYGQDYDAFEQNLDTKSNVATIFRQAQAVFNDWSKLPPNKRKTKDLIDGLSIDFKILLDSVTIARSRKNIIKYYNINNISKFPNRLPPQSYYPELTERKDVLTYKEIYQHLKAMSMSVYRLFDFILDSKTAKYGRKFDMKFRASNFGSNMEKGRQSGIKRLMTVNLLKRLESSMKSFRLTIRGMLDFNKLELRRLDIFDNGQMRPDATTSKKVFNYEAFDQDEDGSLNLVQTDKDKDISIEYADIDRVSWRNAMQEDVRILEHLLGELEKVTPEHDLKLETLKGIIDEKIKNQINPSKKRLLFFRHLPILQTICTTTYING